MNRELWNGVGNIGDDLISAADESAVRSRFKRNRRRLLLRIGSIAACLCLVIGISVPLIGRLASRSGNNKAESSPSGIYISDSETNAESGPLYPYPGFDVLSYSLSTDKSVYSPSEQPIIRLTYGLVTDLLGKGTLLIDISADGFTVSPDNKITQENFIYSENSGSEPNTLDIKLTPSAEDSFGALTIAFYFYPENPETWPFADGLKDGRLDLQMITLNYVINKYETVLSRTNAYDLFELRLVKLYEARTIDAKEFADRYFAAAYADTVCASVSVQRADGSYDFIYRSKNIRYDSPYITDTAIKDAMDADDERLIVRLALEYMLGNGVITQAEYENELAWVAVVRHAGIYDTGFDQNVAKYAHDVLQKNMYTHK